MLCKIRVLGTNNQARVDNFMKGVAAVASAAAGSIPSITGTNANSAANGSAIASGDQYDIIQTVYSNDVAGGWTLDSTHSHTNSYTSGEHGVNTGIFTMYQATGKTDAPYAFFTLMPDTSERFVHLVLQYNALNFSWNSNQASVDNWRNIDYEKCYYLPTPSNGSPSSSWVLDLTGTRDYIVYACEGCIHIQGTTSTVTQRTNHNAGFVHWGTRAHMSWEEAFTDNPYWVHLHVSPGGNMYGYWTDMRYHNYANQTTIASAVAMKGVWNSDFSTTSDTHPIYGTITKSRTSSPLNDLNISQYRQTSESAIYWPNSTMSGSDGAYTNTGSTTTSTSYNLSATTQNRLMQPIIPYSQDLGITSDDTTNAMIPAAVPIWIRSTYGYNMGGNLENILVGTWFSNETDLAAYFTDEATYTIDGTEYIGVRWNAYSVLYIKKQ